LLPLSIDTFSDTVCYMWQNILKQIWRNMIQWLKWKTFLQIFSNQSYHSIWTCHFDNVVCWSWQQSLKQLLSV
jgi:hypothetical protein